MRHICLCVLVVVVLLGSHAASANAGQQDSTPTRWSLAVRLFYPSQVHVGAPVGTPTVDIGCSSVVAAGCEPLPARIGSGGRQSGAGGDSRASIPGFTIDAGMMITERVELGLGMDLSTYAEGHPRQLKTPSYADPTNQFLDASAADEPGMQLDLVGRFRYMAKEQNTIHKRGVIPYFGGGGGLSRYASLSAAGQDGAFYNPVPSLFSAAQPAIPGWIPNLQASIGAQFKLDGLPLFDLEMRYLWLATSMLNASGVRLGAGLRYNF